MCESGLRHQKIQSSRSKAAFFVSEIQCLPVILTPARPALSRSTHFNAHLLRDVGTDDGISGLITLLPTGSG